jgi:hypothetical protein
MAPPSGRAPASAGPGRHRRRCRRCSGRRPGPGRSSRARRTRGKQTEQAFPPATYFRTPEDPPPSQYPLAKPQDCGGEDLPDCSFEIGEHPWCNYNVDQGEKPDGRSVSDSDVAFDDKRGAGGTGAPISFDFDPNLSLTYDLGEVLPLGDSQFV